MLANLNSVNVNKNTTTVTYGFQQQKGYALVIVRINIVHQ